MRSPSNKNLFDPAKAIKFGEYLGSIQAADGSNLWIFAYKNKAYGRLQKPMSESMEKLLDYLCDGSFLDAVVATERPGDYFEKHEVIFRTRHVVDDDD